ncbi:MAG: Lrp/AsnC family transcriptional regulator, partial [Cyanobacteria bacterium J06626_6]
MKNHLRTKNPALDDIDAQLLQILHTESRTSLAELARMLNMSAPSISERLRRLKESGAFCITPRNVAIQIETVKTQPQSLV